MTFAVLAASLVLAATTFAQSGQLKGEHHKKFSIASYLKLTDDQISKMKELRDRYRSDTRDLKYNLAIKRLEMRKLFTEPNTEDSVLLARQKELNGLRMQLMEKRGQMKIEWRKILTAEQISKLDGIHHKWHDKRHSRYKG